MSEVGLCGSQTIEVGRVTPCAPSGGGRAKRTLYHVRGGQRTAPPYQFGPVVCQPDNPGQKSKVGRFKNHDWKQDGSDGGVAFHPLWNRMALYKRRRAIGSLSPDSKHNSLANKRPLPHCISNNGVPLIFATSEVLFKYP